MGATEGWIVVGTGQAPSGKHWRLRVKFSETTDIQVDVQVADDVGWFDLLDQAQRPVSRDCRIDDVRGGWTSGGYVGPPLARDRLISIRLLPEPTVGELAPSVSAVRVRFDDGSEVDAEIVRTYVVGHDYYVAFGPEDELVTAVTALDEEGHAVAEESRSEESNRHYEAFRERLRQDRGM